MVVVDKRIPLSTQQKSLQTASVLTQLLPMDIKLPVVVLPIGGNILTLRTRALLEQLIVDVIRELKAKALGRVLEKILGFNVYPWRYTSATNCRP